MNIKVNMETYVEQIRKQCKKYVFAHFYRKSTYTHTYEVDDIVQEMLLIIWQSFCNCNGLSKVIQKQRLIPGWQLHLIFLNALRNLDLINDKDAEYHSTTAGVIYDENGEVIDFYYPETKEKQDYEKENKIPNGHKREMWVEKIRRLKSFGYDDKQIINMFKQPKQGVLF
ncbi:hypothetical protein [Thermodesulfovibrio yellowstonii]|uniref:Uncharacterized protein n=1 Tax=Thermodesulfovibrio yellowstonii TaxID=28262 RepID=A0A9W6GHI2_9BACT|nr:hypothetical protein [Thermodesulfovibrio islandicus]GLI53981.1 hypothetical protein TISLANDTSLP1_16740 [Thermodesulfovibrio islandicus]